MLEYESIPGVSSSKPFGGRTKAHADITVKSITKMVGNFHCVPCLILDSARSPVLNSGTCLHFSCPIFWQSSMLTVLIPKLSSKFSDRYAIRSFAACRNVIVVSSAVKQRVELWKGSSQLRQVIDCWRSTGVCPLTNETAHNLKVTWDARSVWRPFSHNFLHKMES